MEELLVEIAHFTQHAIEAMAVIIIAYAAVEAFVNVVRLLVTHADDSEARAVWMRFARWLIAGLTFQLAGDIVSTAVTPTWIRIGQVACIAVIRAFLSYCLDRDVESRLERQKEHG